MTDRDSRTRALHAAAARLVLVRKAWAEFKEARAALDRPNPGSRVSPLDMVNRALLAERELDALLTFPGTAEHAPARPVTVAPAEHDHGDVPGRPGLKIEFEPEA